MKLELELIPKFGKNFYHPRNTKAKQLADLLGVKTVSEDLLRKIELMDFEIKIVKPEAV